MDVLIENIQSDETSRLEATLQHLSHLTGPNLMNIVNITSDENAHSILEVIKLLAVICEAASTPKYLKIYQRDKKLLEVLIGTSSVA